MRRCKQDKHLTKKGTLLGPLCSRILIRDSSGVHLLLSAPDRPALGGGAGHGGRKTRQERLPAMADKREKNCGEILHLNK